MIFKLILSSTLIVFFTLQQAFSLNINVGVKHDVKSIKKAIEMSNAHDTIYVHNGLYREANIIINKPLVMIGVDMPTLDGEKKYEIVSIKSSDVTLKGFRVQRSGRASLDDPGAIKIYESRNVCIEENVLYDNFFGIYAQYSKNCIIRNNNIIAFGIDEQNIGNGIHCWKSDSLLIIGNTIQGHRDGIYFEFVTNSVIWRNIAIANVRYGLHFMFSNDDSYISNVFKKNGAGVAVMFTKRVKMINNVFKDNWGDAAYGLLLKEISDSYLFNNQFYSNTTAIYMEGASRINVERNRFVENGWGMKIQASCMDNVIAKNNFEMNTFDVSTNGSLVLNTFDKNYWDKYEGYDLNKDAIGDVSYRPLSLFSVLVETNPSLMILFKSFIVALLDKSEKILPTLTPDNFIDNQPMMKPYL